MLIPAIIIRTIMLDKKLLFPKEFLRLFEKLDLKQNFKCNYYLEKGELKLTLPNTTKKNVILFKINKGEVGKTFTQRHLPFWSAMM